MILENCNSEIRNYLTNFKFKNDYLYERKEYAYKILNLLKTGTSISLFDIRRKGKTTFLKTDIADLASKDMFVFYYSFMVDNLNNPEQVYLDFKESLFDFLFEVVLKENHKSIKKDETFFQKLGFKLNILNNGFEFNLDKVKNSVDFKTLKLKDIFNTINEFKDKPLLLLLDEFQELGKNDEHIHFIRMLRTELDTREWVRAIFTGSSYFALENMFSKYDSPFFKFGLKLDFEDLGDDFVENCIKVFNRRNQKVFISDDKIDELKKIFKENGSFPIFLIDVFYKMEYHQDNNYHHYLVDNQLNSEIEILHNQWKNLSELEKNILYRIANYPLKSVSTKEALDDYSKNMKTDLTFNQLNYCLKKLKEKQILFKENKQSWKLVDQSFYRFIKEIKL